ncbi:MAG: nucleotide exchange factor GrpE [Sphaerochaetaceae bacterium]|nr:nucleotide exchange factor GrpE [Sphaerochaetaceae bacterium]
MKKEKNNETEKEEIKETTETVEENKEEQETEAQNPVEDELESLRGKVKELEEQASQAKDQMLRHQAEVENFRKRLVREREDAVKFANTKLIEEILQFLDNLERAEAAARQGGDAVALADGVAMTRDQLLSALDKNWGLKAIESVGQEFDPECHEACMAAVDESLEHETVLEEFQKGYKLHDRVIRPAKVKIGKPC